MDALLLAAAQSRSSCGRRQRRCAAYVEARGASSCLAAGLRASCRASSLAHPGLLSSVPPLPPVAHLAMTFVGGAGWGATRGAPRLFSPRFSREEAGPGVEEWTSVRRRDVSVGTSPHLCAPPPPLCSTIPAASVPRDPGGCTDSYVAGAGAGVRDELGRRRWLRRPISTQPCRAAWPRPCPFPGLGSPGSPNSQPLVGQAPDAFALTTTAGGAEDADNDEGGVIGTSVRPDGAVRTAESVLLVGQTEALIAHGLRRLPGTRLRCVVPWKADRVSSACATGERVPAVERAGGPRAAGVDDARRAHARRRPPVPPGASLHLPRARQDDPRRGRRPDTGMMAAGMIPGGWAGCVYAAAAPVYAEQAPPPTELGGYVSLGASPAAPPGAPPAGARSLGPDRRPPAPRASAPVRCVRLPPPPPPPPSPHLHLRPRARR